MSLRRTIFPAGRRVLRDGLLGLALALGTAQAADDAAPPPTQAFDLAVMHYQAGEHARAAHLFETLGRLGQPAAYRNLGVMTIKGEGVPANTRAAYAQLRCAALAGDDQAEPLARAAAKLLDASTQAAAEDAAVRCQKNFAQDRVFEWLAGAVRDSAKQTTPTADGAAAHIDRIERVPPVYPKSAAREGRAGVVQMVTHVDADGRLRHPRSVFDTDPVFNTATADAMLGWRVFPAPGGVLPPKTLQRMSFRLKESSAPPVGSNLKPSPMRFARTMQRGFKRAKAAAAKGDAKDALLAAMLSLYIIELDDAATREEQVAWLIEAAKARSPLAIETLVLPDRALSAVDLETPQGLGWMLLGAEMGSAALREHLAERAISAGAESEALFWLASAAATGDAAAVVRHAWALSTAPAASRLDAPRARQMLESVANTYPDQVTWHVTMAAAQAADGNFKQAQASLDSADQAGQALGYQPVEVPERREQYAAKRRTVSPLGSMPWDAQPGG